MNFKSLGIFFIPLCIFAIRNQSTNAQAIQRPSVRACAALDNGLQHNLIQRTPEGSAAAPGKYPYMALIGYQTEDKTVVFPCALIDKRFVLTSAQCIKSRSNGKLAVVRLGITRLDDLAQNNRMVEKNIKFHNHPEFSLFSYYNDIGLVELDSDVNYSPWVYPVCLFTAAIPLNNTELYTTRWGVNGQRIVAAARMRILPIPLCRDAYSDFIDRRIADGIRKTQLCAHNVIEQWHNCSNTANGPMV
ncbi:serine protease Hayan-like [Zeugodacus cucurbitae]|uniref:serine protease Hayan-like n=1 Tax=Zeugodacus cucurbitae TaxID=28588 RepID=UPI0023D901AE|nr:serine protease Hayan-like [Zeugodacus cucurbitae]